VVSDACCEFTGLYVAEDLNLVRILTQMGLVGAGQVRQLPIKRGVWEKNQNRNTFK
jgi:hypothetical protein